MAKMTSQKLREQAKRLLERAKQVDKERATKIGKLIIQYEASNFEGFDLERFKEQISKL